MTIPLLPTQPTRLLVVDDEPPIRQALCRALVLAGYEVNEAASGDEALAQLADAAYDLMILDLNMPGMQGSEVMVRAHERYPDLLIIILTGHATLESAIEAVKSAAVDYLLKPARIQDILATVERALRKRREVQEQQALLDTIGTAMDLIRKKQPQPAEPTPLASPIAPSPTVLVVAHLHLDRETRQVMIHEEGPRMIDLSDGEYQLLLCFMNSPNRVFSCRELVEQAWGYEETEVEAQSLIRPYIFRLRQKLESVPHNPRLLRTVRGRGYLFSPIP